MNRRVWKTLSTLGLAASGLIVSFGGCNQDYAALNGQCQEDDNNVCTIEKCGTDGMVNHEPVPESWNLTCSIGLNTGRCMFGQCMLDCQQGMIPCKCSTDADCPGDNDCAHWACMGNECTLTPLNDGVTIDLTGPGDCQSITCFGGEMTANIDLNDVPMDVSGNCAIGTCTDGIPNVMVDQSDPPPPMACEVFSCDSSGLIVMGAAAVGAACPMGACNSSGMCVDCLPKADWDLCKMTNMPNPCPVPKCDGSACANNSECRTACADGVCCETACTGECKSCNLMGMAGKCTNIAYYQPDSSYMDPNGMVPLTCTVAANGSLCDGMGNCLKIVGKTCMLDADCLSGKCASPSKVCLGAKGEPCANNAQCLSASCVNAVCQ